MQQFYLHDGSCALFHVQADALDELLCALFGTLRGPFRAFLTPSRSGLVQDQHILIQHRLVPARLLSYTDRKHPIQYLVLLHGAFFRSSRRG